ncbi:CBS domain-containing protein [Dongshaea marina]|uniref:CBS domain-containing protein n=1 Tax=Dongshaea marina TaxID=2047966 RepID=UPI000D3E5499|nr:CBS domain-containing protein [Dongshaea marina]
MESLRVGDFMNARTVTFEPDMSLQQAIDKFIQSKQYGGPVVDQYKHLLGWLSERDCIATILEESYHCEQTARVEDVMQKDVLTVSPDDSVLKLVEQQLEAKPKAYPVVEQGILRGVITRHEMMKALKVHMSACYKK